MNETEKRKLIKEYLHQTQQKYIVFFEANQLKYYNLLQIDVLKKLADETGYVNFNDFCSSSDGQTSMRLYQKITLDLFGPSKNNKNLPDSEKIQDVYEDPARKNSVIQTIASKILAFLVK